MPKQGRENHLSKNTDPGVKWIVDPVRLFGCHHDEKEGSTKQVNHAAEETIGQSHSTFLTE